MLTEAELKLTKQVAELFKKNYRRGPWPNDAQCYPVAAIINVVRNSKGYRETFIEGNVTLRGRRAVVEATRRLLDNQKKILNTQLDSFKPLRLSGWVEDLSNLRALDVALERATPALLRPFNPLAGERNKAWWHEAAYMIAERARTAVEEARRKPASIQKHGAFVKVVTDALKLATGEDFEPATVASALAKTTY
jgi:hypothetical protein